MIIQNEFHQTLIDAAAEQGWNEESQILYLVCFLDRLNEKMSGVVEQDFATYLKEQIELEKIHLEHAHYTTKTKGTGSMNNVDEVLLREFTKILNRFANADGKFNIEDLGTVHHVGTALFGVNLDMVLQTWQTMRDILSSPLKS